MKLTIILLCLISSCSASSRVDRPNIVIIMADDLGWNDVSFHGSSEILTPNIDALAYNGVILNRHYVAPLCTPSRAQMMTGKYAIHTGMQHFVIDADEPWGLGLNEEIMPEYFQNNNYNTHLVGKWHLGYFKKEYTPTFRGFDSHFGYLGPYIDYWDHTLIMLDRNYSRGLDMRKNLELFREKKGIYATNLFTDAAVNIIHSHDTQKPLFLMLNHLSPHTGNEDDPMQAPMEEINKFKHIKDKKRRTLAAMISILDQGVGQVVDALNRKGILDNTIILFYSDNGGPTLGRHSTAASNYPLRGQKYSPWEGAVRGVAVIWSSKIKNNQIVSNNYVHVTDWLPTFAEASGFNLGNTRKLDGISNWNSILRNKNGKRVELVNNIDDNTGYSSITHKDWKLVKGTSLNGIYDGWLGLTQEGNFNYVNDTHYATIVLNSVSNLALTSVMINKKRAKLLTSDKILGLREEAQIYCVVPKSNILCKPLEKPCLFNIYQDPCERNNLAELHPRRLSMMLNLLQKINSTAVPIRNKKSDSRADPTLHNGAWTWWLTKTDKCSIDISREFIK